MPLLSKLPPGPSFILRQLLSWEFVSFAAAIYSICIGNKALGLNLPPWVVVSCTILALPCIPLFHAQYQYWRDGRKAASLGARLVPTVPMRLPGGIDLVATLRKAFRTGYIGVHIHLHRAQRLTRILAGDGFVDWLAEGGQTVDMRTLWTTRVSLYSCTHYLKDRSVRCQIITTEPQYIKVI